MQQDIFTEEDESINCVNYPNEDNESYKECDDKFLTSVLPPGLVPIWSVNNFENVTRQLYIEKMPNTSFSYGDLHDGTQISPCPLPCSTISVDSRLIFEEINSKNVSVLDLTFSQSVMVTTVEFLKFSFSNFLSDLGGSMGLWLGIGLLQTVQMAIQLVLPRIKCRL